ncbi:hypothetical protein I79_022231 [Cricetulus griseus]|uniref:Uncharacterized protein n=1 Tax=Cricetulus griseus TaxID=10029 RepID=G3IES8_CRIGR|nr:hypothetical protein I79_022231 [Cricetulus griseus]
MSVSRGLTGWKYKTENEVGGPYRVWRVDLSQVLPKVPLYCLLVFFFLISVMFSIEIQDPSAVTSIGLGL